MKTGSVVLIRNAASTDFGGGEKVPVYIARQAKKKGLEVYLFSHSEKVLRFAKQEKVPHIKTWWLPIQNWSGARILLTPFYFLWLMVLFIHYTYLFKTLRAKLVHVQSKDDFIAGSMAASLCGAKVLWSDYADLKHIWRNVDVWYKNPIGKLVRWSAKHTDEILVVSREDQRLIEATMPGHPVLKKLRVVYNGAFDSYQRRKGGSQGQFTFISTARLVTDKGIAELITAFNQLSKEHPSSRLLIVGDGPEAKDFKKLPLPGVKVEFVGHVKDPRTYLSKSDVFVLPTYHEGFSLALVEACMEGLPIITTRVGGNTEIITDGTNGILIPPKNVSALHSSMRRILEDEKLRKKLGRNARDTYLSKFNFEKIIDDEFLKRYVSA